jgi:transcriptional regulator with XRE-family HTH domain
MSLGTRIQKLRKSRQLSQEAFADIMKVSRQSVSKWELDQAYPEIKKMIEMADYFHITLDELLRENSDEETTKQNDDLLFDRDYSCNENMSNGEIQKDEYKTYSNGRAMQAKEDMTIPKNKVIIIIILFFCFLLYGYYSGSFITLITYVLTLLAVFCKRTITRACKNRKEY